MVEAFGKVGCGTCFIHRGSVIVDVPKHHAARSCLGLRTANAGIPCNVGPGLGHVRRPHEHGLASSKATRKPNYKLLRIEHECAWVVMDAELGYLGTRELWITSCGQYCAHTTQRGAHTDEKSTFHVPFKVSRMKDDRYIGACSSCGPRINGNEPANKNMQSLARRRFPHLDTDTVDRLASSTVGLIQLQ